MKPDLPNIDRKALTNKEKKLLLGASFEAIMNSIWGMPSSWNAFWFSTLERTSMARVRKAFAICLVLWFSACFFWVPQWLSQDGWLGTEAGRYLIGVDRVGTGSEYRWSILYRGATQPVATALCGAGVVSCILMFLGITGRIGVFCVWGLMMMVHHRAPWLTTSAEVLASAALLYLAIDPGTPFFRRRSGVTGSKDHTVLANVALRCLQVHWIIWLAFSLASMLSHSQWWDGTAVAILTEQGSTGIGKLSRVGWATQIAGFFFLGLHALVILCLMRRELQGIGLLLIGLLGMTYVAFVGDWMFCGVAWCYAMAFVPNGQAKKI